MNFMDGLALGGGGGEDVQSVRDHSAVDRLGAANEDNAAHFIWFELSKELKAEWDTRLIRSVLDTCPRFEALTEHNSFACCDFGILMICMLKDNRYSLASSSSGSRFVKLFEDVTHPGSHPLHFYPALTLRCRF